MSREQAIKDRLKKWGSVDAIIESAFEYENFADDALDIAILSMEVLKLRAEKLGFLEGLALRS